MMRDKKESYEERDFLNIRVNPTVKQRAEDVLSKLGIPMSTAIDIYLHQISYTGEIPFDVKLPEAPKSVNADLMSDEELCFHGEASMKKYMIDITSKALYRW